MNIPVSVNKPANLAKGDIAVLLTPGIFVHFTCFFLVDLIAIRSSGLVYIRGRYSRRGIGGPDVVDWKRVSSVEKDFRETASRDV